MSDRKSWIRAGIFTHVSALALAACVLPPVQEPASCPPGASLRQTEQGPLCVADHRPGPGPGEPVANAPDERGEPGWSAEPPPADPPPVPAEPPVAPEAAPAPVPLPPPGASPAPSSPAPPSPAASPGSRVQRSWHRDGVLAEEIWIEDGVIHGPWLRKDISGRTVDKGFFAVGWPAGEWARWDAQGKLQHTCVFQRDSELLATCQVYRAGVLASVQSYVDRRAWPARSLADLLGVHAMSNLTERHGPWVEYNTTSGRKVSEGSYEHGKEAGAWTRWSLAGTVRLQESYRNGQREGGYAEWHQNGRERQQGTYSAGRKHGLWTTWSEAGVVIEKVTYDMGVEHGGVERFHPGGKPRERGSYESGTKTGVWETWHEDGRLRWRGQYVNGRPHGPWEIRDEDGRVARGPYVDGARHGAWKLETPAGWEPGKDMYIERGQYVGGRRDGVWITRGPGGWMQSQGRYDRGTRLGRWRVWNQAGQVVADVHYHVSGKLHGSFTRWHDNGVVAEQGELVAGVKVGAWIARDPDGAVLYRGGYRDGEKHGAWQERARAGAALDDRLYDHGEVIPRHGYEAHVALGSLQAPGRDAAVPDVLSLDVALVREHRLGEGHLFLGYGVELMVEDADELATSAAVGVPLRAGAMSTARRRSSGLARGTYAYAQVTPFLRLGDGGADVGARLSVGLTSPGYSRFWVRSRDHHGDDVGEFFQIVTFPLRLAVASINHVELVYEHDRAHGAQIGVMFGLGL